ncbi:MAG: DNA/RNA non-specific endonuclease [Bacteroidia bacterium]
MRFFIFFLAVLFLHTGLFAQNTEAEIRSMQAMIELAKNQIVSYEKELEELKLKSVREKLDKAGYPPGERITHSAMVLSYAEEHEQARWVVHIITPDVEDLGAGRSNDFREDPLVTTGTAQEIDYFLKKELPDGSFEYDGFGYDRGHLAPSADFRWSAKALSESYYYSNMSPQLPECNREVWADIESFLRAYVIRNKVELYVLTAPVLTPDLPKVERATNSLSIPGKFIKVAIDPANKRAIGFVVKNEASPVHFSTLAASVDEVEELVRYNVFPNFPEEWERSFEPSDWFSEEDQGNAKPLDIGSLPAKHLNTTFGAEQKGSGNTVFVCGTVVGTRYSRSGHAWLNLDQKYPNEVFSIMIRKEHLVNFDFDPVEKLQGKVLCFKGEVSNFGGKAVMEVDRPELLEFLED